MNLLSILKSQAHEVGMYVKRQYGGNVYELYQGDYLRFVGDFDEMQDAIEAEHHRRENAKR